MDLNTSIKKRIAQYDPAGQLDFTSRIFMAIGEINHRSTLEHMQRVALMAEACAKILGWDCKAAFFAGLLHDVGKFTLPAKLFDGHDISEEEYAQIKTHARAAFKILKPFHGFTALCAGLHHAIYAHGYGLEIEDFPKKWSPETTKKILEISALISICDFIDAATHRHNRWREAPSDGPVDLRQALYEKYSYDHHIIDVALEQIID